MRRNARPGTRLAGCMLGILLGMAAGCSSGTSPAVTRKDGLSADQRQLVSANWQPRLVTVDGALLRGMVVDGPDLGQTPILYPAPSVGAGIAGVFIHSAMVAGSADSKRKAAQDAADAVTTPYQPAVQATTSAALLAAALRSSTRGSERQLLTAGNAGRRNQPEILFAPIYRLTPDERALVLDLGIQARPDGASSDHHFETMVRVVSAAVDGSGDEARQVWLADGGAPLRTAMEQLMTTGVDLGVADVTGQLDAASPAQTTYRLQIGGDQRFERGSSLRTDCGRATIRSLRGWVIQAPIADAGC